jgi:hypothetical protein
MNLSRFFTLAEMTRSDSATRANIPNEPTQTEIANLRALCTSVLDPLRDALGGPIKVSSGYRGPTLNTLIHGAKRSQHVEGKAADIQASGKSILELFQTVIRLNLPFDQVIYEAQSPTVVWVHVSHNPAGNRGQIMRAEFENGRAVRYPVISAETALAMTDPNVRRDGVVPEWSYVEAADEPEEVEAPRAKPTKKQAAKRAAKPRPAKRAAKRTSVKSRSAKRTSVKTKSVKSKTNRSKQKRRR